MKIDDRTKKLLLFLLLVIVFVAPMLLIFKPMFENTKELAADNEKRQAKIDELKELYDKKGYYESSIAEMASIEEKILESFDKGLPQENTIMFVRNEAEKTPFVVTGLNFGEMTEVELRPETFDKDGNLTGGLKYIERQTTIEVDCTYDQFKTFMNSILQQPEKMSLVGVNAEYKDENGRIEGLFILEQYAFTGYNREDQRLQIPALEHGNIDKGGIFGNFIEDEDIRKEVFPEEENKEE